MSENPALAIKAPKADMPPTLPYTDEEVDRTIAAAKGFRIGHRSTHAARLLSFPGRDSMKIFWGERLPTRQKPRIGTGEGERAIAAASPCRA
jgi:hypothetical protein